ncbi:MAG: NB-ARC domain-containing protein, partial [Chloroflexota bacterium]
MNIDELATSDIEFHEALKGYMDARRYSLDALLRAIEDVVLELRTKKEVSAAKLQPIKKEKMRGWLYIKEKNKPRRLPRDWRDVIKIAYALELPLKNVNHLLSAAKKPSLQQLKKQVTSEDELALVSRWKIALVNLPPKSDYMVGRADHIKKATRFLRSNLPKVMNIYGPSGRGKSHLIRHLLDAEKANTADELNRFTQGIIWLYGHKKPEDLIQAFEELHIRYPPSLEKSNHRQIQFYLETKDLLIIFDDVESFEQLKDYFPNNLQAKLILISESPLDMPIKSMPLDLPAFSMNGEDAINLFDQYKKNSNWKNKHQAHLIQLSALLGQTPKHIDEYAQQFARNASILPEDIVQQLKNNPHQTHAEIFDPFFASDQTVLEKYKLLSDVQKRFARGICWMPTNSFTLEAAAAFAPFGEVKSHYLKPLENNKLILSIEPERKQKNLPTKWEFQPNIQFSLRRLSPANEANEAKVKIADYYLNFAVRNSENFKHLEMEQKGIRLILEQMLNQDELEAFTKGFTAMSRYWLSSGFFQDGLSLSDAFINKLFPLPEDDSTLNQPFDQIQAASYIEFERDFLEVYMSFISLSYQMDGTQGIRSHLNNLEKIIDVIKYPVLRARFLNNKAT